MASPLVRRDMFMGAPVPRAGLVISTILSMVTIAVLACCLMRRISAIKQWSKVPLTGWLIFAIYADSMLFITCTTILSHGFGLNTSQTVCSMAILLCLVCYMSTKLIYYFLVEKVYIIRRVSKPRLRSKLYLFNCFGMLFPYVVCVILNFVFRIAYFDDKGTCIIGMELKAMMPLIIFDAVVNFYLTMLFVIPLRSLYSYKNNPNSALRTIALRSFVGSLGTLTSSVVNLTVLMVLRGEAAWICLMCCNADILFSVVVLHWVTTKDNSAANASLGSNGPYAHSGHNLKNGLAAGAVDGSRVRDTKQFDNLETGLKAQFETCISARDLSDGIDEDMRREALGNGAAFPLDRIVVSVGQVRTVEGRSESGTTRSEVRSEVSTNDDYVRRAVSHKSSTEDLVRKNSPR